MRVEHDVVRPAQLVRAAAVVQHADRAGLRIHPLDPAAGVVRRLHGRPQQAHLQPPGEAAVVADVERAVRPHRHAVRPAAGPRDHLHRAVRQHAADGLTLDLHQHHRAVPHRHRSLRKAQPRGHDAQFAHCPFPWIWRCVLDARSVPDSWHLREMAVRGVGKPRRCRRCPGGYGAAQPARHLPSRVAGPSLDGRPPLPSHRLPARMRGAGHVRRC